MVRQRIREILIDVTIPGTVELSKGGLFWSSIILQWQCESHLCRLAATLAGLDSPREGPCGLVVLHGLPLIVD